MGSMRTLSNMIPLGMMFNTVHKISDYGMGIKDGLSRTYGDVASKILDHGQSGVQKVLEIGSNGARAAFDLGRMIFIPEPKNQQTGGGFGGRYTSPPQQNTTPGYSFNPNQPFPAQMGQPFPAQMGYNNMQPYAGVGQLMGGNNNGQPLPHGTTPQMIEYSPQKPEPINYVASNPINNPQPIVHRPV